MVGKLTAGKPAPVTIVLLTFGEHAALAERAVESFHTNCPRPGVHLLVGANAVGSATRRYLAAARDAGRIDGLVSSPVNLHKAPMMRRLLARVETEFTWWFDDDSFITLPAAFDHYLSAAVAAPADVVLWGQEAVCTQPAHFTPLADAVDWVRRARWYGGLTPPTWAPGGLGEFDYQGRGTGDGNWRFILGGAWFARTAALRQLGWPDSRLRRYGDDVFLCEALRQQGLRYQNTERFGIAIDTEPRRWR